MKQFVVRFEGAKHFVIALRDNLFHAVADGFEVIRLDDKNVASIQSRVDLLESDLGHVSTVSW